MNVLVEGRREGKAFQLFLPLDSFPSRAPSLPPKRRELKSFFSSRFCTKKNGNIDIRIRSRNVHTILFPFASNCERSFYDCSRSKVFMSNYPSLITHYLLVICFYCFRNFPPQPTFIRNIRQKTMMCHWDNVLWHWAVKWSPQLETFEISRDFLALEIFFKRTFNDYCWICLKSNLDKI